LTNQNKIILIGNLANDPEINVTTNGFSLAKFTLVVERPKSQEREARKDFIKIIAWRNLADLVKTDCKKNTQALVEGRINTGHYDDENGKRHWTTEVEAKEIKILTSQPDNNQVDTAPESTTATVSSLKEKPLEQINESDFDFNFEPKKDDNAATTEDEEIPF